MSCIKLTGSPARLSHKMHAYAVASLCGRARVRGPQDWRCSMTVYTATLTRRRTFGLRSPPAINGDPCATAQGALIDPCAKYTHRLGWMLHTRQSDLLEVVGSAE